MRATIYSKSTPRYYFLQAGKKYNGDKRCGSFRVAALRVVPLFSRRLSARVCPDLYIWFKII